MGGICYRCYRCLQVFTGAYRCLQVGYGRGVEVLQVITGPYRSLQVAGEREGQLRSWGNLQKSRQVGYDKDMMSEDRVKELEKEIESLRKRWPAHSIPPAMMARLDALEEELTLALKQMDEGVTFEFRAIGYVENELGEGTKAEELRASLSRIVLDPGFVEGLTGLEPGMEVMVLFVFHRAEGTDLLQHPRGDRSRPKRGVFTLRSPRRPNPIGVTEVEVVSIERNVLTVRGLDAFHGTPVLDIKPVM